MKRTLSSLLIRLQRSIYTLAFSGPCNRQGKSETNKFSYMSGKNSGRTGGIAKYCYSATAIWHYNVLTEVNNNNKWRRDMFLRAAEGHTCGRKKPFSIWWTHTLRLFQLEALVASGCASNYGAKEKPCWKKNPFWKNQYLESALIFLASKNAH